MKENGLEHVIFSTADGALEAAPAVRVKFSLSTCILVFSLKLFKIERAGCSSFYGSVY